MIESPEIDYSLKEFGEIWSAKLVSELGSHKVYVAFSGELSDETYFIDVSEHFEFPFQREEGQRSRILLFEYCLLI